MKQAEITVEYLDHLGTDLTVVNAARTSFGKESDWLPSGAPADYLGVVYQQRFIEGRTRPVNLSQADANLIRFLATGYRSSEWDALLDEVIDHARHGSKDELTEILQHYKKSAQHWAPFAHPHMQIRMKLPMFLARQFVKHQIGGAWSEESRRYMSSEPEFWFPKEWHGRPEDIKQGSGYAIGPQVFQDDLSDRAEKVAVHALNTYEEMVAAGVAPEEARIVLPLNTMTTVTWTGSLLFWSRVCNQRLDNHAQKAANELAEQIAAIAQPLFPVSWAALVG
jgi:thymidylate synthase (FAD)